VAVLPHDVSADGGEGVVPAVLQAGDEPPRV